MKTGMISALQKFSLHDGPGIRTIVFFKGCPLRCPWCSNPETRDASPDIMYNPELCMGCGLCIKNCPAGAIEKCEAGPRFLREKCVGCGKCAAVCPQEALTLSGEEMTVGQVLAEVQKDRAFYRKSGGGVTFSGGEPLMQGEFLRALAARCKKEYLHTAIETTGYAPREEVEALLPLVDLFLFDLKIIDPTLHKKHLGVDNGVILENLQTILSAGKEVHLRLPIVPGYTDSLENLEGIAHTARQMSCKQVHLLPYHNYGEKKYAKLGRPYPLKGVASQRKEDLTVYKPIFEQQGLNVKLGG